MGPLATCDAKLTKAKALCNNRLTDIRSEESRRVNLILTILFIHACSSLAVILASIMLNWERKGLQRSLLKG